MLAFFRVEIKLYHKCSSTKSETKFLYEKYKSLPFWTARLAPFSYKYIYSVPVLRIRTRIRRIHMFLRLPDPLVRYTDPDPESEPSIIKQK